MADGKVPVEYLRFMWPMRTFLITCGEAEGEANIIAVSFCMPVSKDPPLIACAIGKTSHSAKLIESKGEFVVNVPESGLKSQVYYCGYHSGASVDKFKETGLTPRPGRKVSSAYIEECSAHMECVLRDRFITGDKFLFVGEVVEAYAESDIVEGKRELELESGEFPAHVYSIRAGREGRE